MYSFRIVEAGADDYPALTELWEGSVRATHGFLSESDLLDIRRQMPSKYLPSVKLYCATAADGRIAAFAGIDGVKLEMLFVRADMFGCGAGSALLDYAVGLGVCRTEVNEQNERALKFYLSKGFSVVSRDPADSAGRPYPILHLKRA